NGPDATSTPSAGFRMPAEWEPHESTWLAWPHEESDWPGKLAAIPWVYAEIIRHLHRVERVHLVVNDAANESLARQALTKAGIDFSRLHFHLWPTDRVWMRDSGPTFLVGPKGERGLLDWRFNAWAKYSNWHADDLIPGRIADLSGDPIWQPTRDGRRIVLEGGSIDVNGRGLLLTTEECLLSDIQCRNPG